MKRSALSALLAALLFGCGGQSVKVYLTDAPLDGATEVNITVTGVQAIAAGAAAGAGAAAAAGERAPGGAGSEEGVSTLTFSEPREINLLELRNGVRTLLGEVESEGSIEQLRLMMNGEAVVVFEDGSSKTALVPSGAQTGVKIVGGIPAGATEITLDFDAAQSITETGTGELIMRPTIRALIEDEVVGETPAAE